MTMPSVEEAPLEECPPPQTAMAMFWETANVIAEDTSWGFDGMTTIAYEVLALSEDMTTQHTALFTQAALHRCNFSS